MKKLTLALVIALLFYENFSTANPVSQEEARKIAISWYTHIAREAVSDFSIMDVVALNHDEIVTMYVFTFTSGGFVIVAADDASIPILGYSEENPFPLDISCPAVKEWLEDYSVQIIQIIKGGLSNNETRPQWDAILKGCFHGSTRDVGPLLTTTWFQGCFYNELCPTDPAGPCDHAVTGCMATAMAQIMKFHSFPPHGVGSYTYTHPYYGEQSADFGNTVYDWATMPDLPTTDNIPLATIMYHTGVAINMYYGPDESGGSINVPEALVDYFNYQPGSEWHNMVDYPDPEDWKTLLRSDLDNHLPVYYIGAKPDVGHAFVCDGYRTGEETFHMNWGWNGLYDGWYVIGQLNNSYGSWNLDNVILTKIKPYNPELITRITHLADDFVVRSGTQVVIDAATVRGSADRMKITVDGITVATGTSNTLFYTWNTQHGDLGSHEIKSWSYSGNDSVYYPINLNVAEWVTQASGFPTTLRAVTCISAIDSNVVWASAWDGIGYWEVPCQDFTRTTDGGQTWVAGKIVNGDNLTACMIEGVSSQKAYAAMYRFAPGAPQGIYVTTDGGSTWEHQATASFSNSNSWPGSVHFFNENDGWCMGDPLTAGGGFEMYTTMNGGTNWITVPAANIPATIPTEMGVQDFAAIEDTILVGTSFGRIFKSTDRGYTWTAITADGMEGEFIVPVFRNGSHGLVFNWFKHISATKLCETFDGGETWQPVDYSGPLYQTDLVFVPGSLNTWVSSGSVFGLNVKGASYSEDGGHTWVEFPGTRGADFGNMAWVSPRCGWAGSINSSATDGGIFKFVGDLSAPSATNDFDPNTTSFSVFPNPFHSTATIEFFVPKTGFVILSVYDISGKLLERILSEKLTSGEHRCEWNAGSLKTGVYFMRLELESMTQVKKVIIINSL